ncbi:glycoside hydrolase family 113 [Gorillibacterium sp. sgz5001074]|uniref:glycoside hydrolase family 113 n=1 Tax=Gorillibacterium sp. sgz5001074 TaxID=3446695 RepID=UPI003F681FED
MGEASMVLGTEYVCGMTWGWTGVRGTWSTPEAEESFARMSELGVNWVTLAFGALQDHPQATEIRFREEPTVTDEEIRAAAAMARKHGLKICLKPVVNCRNGVWRAHISFFEQDVPGEPTWKEWFRSYGAFMVHYAELAEELGCELFCVGCEMVQMDRYADAWRSLVEDVREVYSGPVTYNCDKYQEDRVSWWDAVDVISSSGYYPEGSWEEQLERIGRNVRAHGKPFLFLEGGCPSRTGSSRMPNDWSLPGQADEEEQAAYYRSMFGAVAEHADWLRGFMLWDWPARLYPLEEAAANRDYCMYGKSAEPVVRDAYARLRTATAAEG